MDQFKSFVSNMRGIWQSPEQAVIAEDISDAFVSDSAPSTDTLSANTYKTTFVNDFADSAESDSHETKLYAVEKCAEINDEADSYEEFDKPNFTVARSAKGDDTISFDSEYEISASTKSTYNQTVASAKTYCYANAVDTSFLTFGMPKSSTIVSTPKMQYTETSANYTAPARNEQTVQNTVKASVGFNTATTSATPNSSYTASRISGGRSMTSDKYSVQVLRPTTVEEVNEACTLLKDGNVVMTVLSGIADRTARLRYLDYLSGCCKGCDADFKEIVKVDSIDAVLIASPRGIGIKFPIPAASVENTQTTATGAASSAASASSNAASAFANVFGTTNWVPSRTK